MTAAGGREGLQRLVHHMADEVATVEWVEPGTYWSAHARLRGRTTGRVSHILSTPDVQEARFEDPVCTAVILTDGDEDEVHEALAKLVRAAVEYVAGGGHVEQEKRLLGSRSLLVLRTSDGDWRIGKRSGSLPF